MYWLHNSVDSELLRGCLDRLCLCDLHNSVAEFFCPSLPVWCVFIRIFYYTPAAIHKLEIKQRKYKGPCSFLPHSCISRKIISPTFMLLLLMMDWMSTNLLRSTMMLWEVGMRHLLTKIHHSLASGFRLCHVTEPLWAPVFQGVLL